MSRTIADLAWSELLKEVHVAKVLQYRCMDIKNDHQAFFFYDSYAFQVLPKGACLCPCRHIHITTWVLF
ncbi:hypothetical protein [Pelotomaculum sp. FP]|uniref:hypothetical protein n=1 Tax=Pelotomaculum sp. FP TaxID=261474 RepID=UPI0012919459|nr:hypothetical protein [Pelotomaculum sp. FP]